MIIETDGSRYEIARTYTEAEVAEAMVEIGDAIDALLIGMGFALTDDHAEARTHLSNDGSVLEVKWKLTAYPTTR